MAGTTEALRLAIIAMLTCLLIWSSPGGCGAIASATAQGEDSQNVTEINAGVLLEGKLAEQPDLTMFVQALLVSDTFHVAISRANGGGVTVLAPNNTAFSVFDPAVLDCLYSKPASLNVLSQITKYHILVGNHNATELIAMQTVHADSGLPLHFNLTSRGRVRISDDDGGEAFMTRPDFRLLINSTIHVIDTVMIPPVIESVFATECFAYANSNDAPSSSDAPPSFHL
ncbi:hypothetical protein CBR_g38489 [Chara braunii]|uniref:FAS1 domain-containing protein n=1 Tax=Chara braunii TaxID=69332 RepID=A0A388JNW3_CHABU|nr:hypothetical protein CBR_g38489 [Chara braunii]|eukprot:GBG59465.1 hypothetical protein CBR_g38489 [Chara braunii]